MPLRTEVCHELLSLAAISQVVVLTLHFFTLYLMQSLTLFFWPPWFLRPFKVHGRFWFFTLIHADYMVSSVRTMQYMLTISKKTSVSGILSCHLMFIIFLRQSWFSCLVCCPWFTGIEQGRENYRLVYLKPSLKLEISFIANFDAYSSKCTFLALNSSWIPQNTDIVHGFIIN